MRRTHLVNIAIGFASLLFASHALANEPYEEYDRLINKRTAVGALGTDLFGDELSYYTGSLSFRQTDISVPGNDALSVALTRTIAAEGGHGAPGEAKERNEAPFADWDMDLPSISATVTKTYGWTGANDSVDTRCSQPSAPKTLNAGGRDFPPELYWSGYTMHLPGGGGGEMLISRSDVQKPTTGGPYPWVTSNWTYISCLQSLANAPGQGEGFLAVTADGTKYWFNWLATYFANDLKENQLPPQTGDFRIERQRLGLYATRVEDRFGNWVTYTYTNTSTQPIRVSSITSKDGRSITFDYNTGGFVWHATAGGKTWTYDYVGLGSTGALLSAATQPDGKQWLFNIAALTHVPIRYEKEPGITSRNCMDPGSVISGPKTGSMTHPSGAVAEFTVSPTRFGRSNVLVMCRNVRSTFSAPNDTSDDSAIYPIRWDSAALTHKRVSGPGLTTADWDYDYFSTTSYFFAGGGNEDLPVCTSGDCYSPQCTSDACAGTLVTSVFGPGPTFTRYTFGNSYRYNEGKLLKVEEGDSATSILRTKTMTYELAQSGQPFPTPIGTSPQYSSSAGFSTEYIRPQKSATTAQQGETFNSATTSFDLFAHPLATSKWSSLGMSRTETTEYFNDYALWSLGQAQRQTVNGTEVSRTDFDSLDRPWKNYSFGQLVQTLAYDPIDSTVTSVTDGRGSATLLSMWKRGIPQVITYPATPEAPQGTTKSASVTDLGWITSVVDENGFATGYGYDDMGRIAAIQPAAINGATSTPTTIVFESVAQDELGIPAGHWRRTETTGNAKKVAYFDALWRPLDEETYDAANISGTYAIVRKRFDIDGHTTFASYPLNPYLSGWTAIDSGTRTTYDAIGRVTRVEQDSELGVLSTTTVYQPGLVTQVTNPRGQTTTTSYDAYDAPSYDQPRVIQQPAGVKTEIVRNGFGNTTEVKRSGPEG